MQVGKNKIIFCSIILKNNFIDYLSQSGQHKYHGSKKEESSKEESKETSLISVVLKSTI